MTRPVSAGLVIYRRRVAAPEFLLVHPGGPYWAGKDEAAWSIPKGLVEAEEAAEAAARREAAEELGLAVGGGGEPLSPVKTPGGKLILAWLVEADLDVGAVESQSFELEWPPRSGRLQSFPEVDRAGYFPLAEALSKIHRGQRPLLLEASERLRARGLS